MKDFYFKWSKVDWLLFLAIVILLLFSLSILYSLNLNSEDSSFLIFKKQLLFAFSGLVLYFFFASINYKVWSTYSKIIYIVSILVLASVLFFGTEVKGTTGWIRLGAINIQPVEFAKIALIIWQAKYFSKHANEFKFFKHIFLSGIGTLAFVLLIVLQPDLGSALVLLGTWVITLLFTGIRRKHFLWLFTLFTVASVSAWFFVFKVYQKARILTFINPSRDPQGDGYNVIQSIIAVGAGKFFGRGLTFGSQSSLSFLPEPGTDFIFSVIAEDLGFVGGILMLAVFTFVFYRLFLLMQKSQDDFGAYLVLGVASMLLVQLFINVGMNMGISPVTGIPLPLISAGGSSLWAILIALGIVQNIGIRNN